MVLDINYGMEDRQFRKPMWRLYLRRVLVALNVVLFALIAGILLSRVGSGQDSAPVGMEIHRAQNADEQGNTMLMPSLRISTRPVNARIYLNGRFAGVSPLRLADLHPGRYEIEVRKQGYRAASFRTNLAFGQSEKVELALQAVTGGLVIESVPPGARVTLDGRRKRGVTPLRLEDLQPGTYRLRMQKNGHKAVTTSVTVREGEIIQVRERLALSSLRRFSITFWDAFFDLAHLGQRRSSGAGQRALDQQAPVTNASPTTQTRSSAHMAANRRASSSPSTSDNASLSEPVSEKPPTSNHASIPAQTQQTESPPGNPSSLMQAATIAPTSNRQVTKRNQQPVHRVSPIYPARALERGTEGIVRFELTVQRDGRVSDVRLLDNSRPRVFDRAVLRALRSWRFEPGSPQAWSYSGEIEFRLDD